MAHRAVGQARDARERRNEDDLLSLCGKFGFSLASQHYLAGSTLLEITGAERGLIAELERGNGARVSAAVIPGPADSRQ